MYITAHTSVFVHIRKANIHIEKYFGLQFFTYIELNDFVVVLNNSSKSGQILLFVCLFYAFMYITVYCINIKPFEIWPNCIQGGLKKHSSVKESSRRW